MDQITRDDFIHALTQTQAFYGKTLERMQITFWLDACRDFGIEKLKSAMREHVRRSKYAPKPADIIEICREGGAQQAQHALPAPEKAHREQTELDRAWVYCIKLFCQGAAGPLGRAYGDGFKRIDPELEERYLHLVNHHAHQQDTPESIPEGFKLREVWG